MKNLKILFVEDLSTDVEIAQREISKEKISFEPKVVDTEEEFKKALTEFKPDLIISDYSMPKFDGMRALKITRSQPDYIPFIVLTGSMNEETAVTCMKTGADDYVLKEKIRRLPFAVQEVLQKHLANQAKRQALQDLNKSEEKYRLLVSSLNEGLMQVDNDDRILFVNQTLCDIFGYTKAELIGKIGYETLIAKEDQKTIKEKNQQRKQISYENYKVRGRKKSGDIIWLNISGSAVKDDEGNIIGSVGLLTDITEQKQAEEALSESEEKYKTLVNSTLQGVVIAQTNPVRLAFANPAMTQISGYTPEKLVGMGPNEIAELIYEEDRQRFFSNFQKRIQGIDFSHQDEYRIVTKDGTIKWVALFSSQIEYHNEPATLTTFMDITQRKLAEAELRESEKELSQAQRIAKIGSCLFIPHTGKVHLSDEMYNILGMEKNSEALCFRNHKKHYTPESWQKFNEELQKALITGEFDEIEMEIIRNDGNRIVLASAETIKDEEGKVIEFRGTLQDITEHKRLEQELIDQKDLLTAIFKNAPLVLMVVNSERRLQQVNGYAAQFAGRNAEEMLGLRGGEALRCLHVLDDPRGCGFGEFCQQCVIRNTVLDTIETGEIYLQKEAPYYFKGENDQIQEMTLLASTTPIMVKGERMVLVTLQDITERKQAEAALKESEEKFRSLIESSNDGICLQDLQGKIIFTNTRKLELLGFDNEKQLLGTNVFDLLKESDQQRFKELIPVLMKKGFLTNIETEVIKQDGSFLTVDLNFRLIRDDNGNPRYIMDTMRDITERKQAEEEIRKQKEFLRKVIDTIPAFVCVKKIDGSYELANKALCDAYGTTPEGLEGHKDSDFSPRDEEVEAFLQDDLRVINTQKMLHIPEEKITYADGSIHWLSTIKAPVREQDGSCEKLLAVAMDITERKLSEEAIRESEEKFRKLAENTSDIIAIMDLQGKITYISRSIKAELGYRKDEIEGTDIQEFLTPESYKVAMNRLQKRLNEEDINAPFEVGLLKKSGETVPFELNTSTITEKGELKGIQIVARNITERKQAEIRQTTLFKISDTLNKTDNIIEFFNKIREHLSEVVDTTNFYVALYDAETDTISLPYNVDQKDQYETFPAGKTLTKYVIQTAKPLFAKRSQLNELTQKGIIESIGTPSEVWLGVPLMVENKVIGVIALQSYDDPDLYSEKDLEMLSFVSEEIAMIIQRKQAQDEIRKNLTEKELLLKELYHRTKNNMQVIASMLKLQARHLGNEQLYNSYQEVIAKINSMALVHQKLYEAKDLSSINLKEYISDLARNLRKNYGIEKTKVQWEFNLQKIFVNIDTAIPLSLVLTELISNVFKHAFPKGEDGKINLNLFEDKEKQIVLELADNGVGVPQNIDLRKTKTMGLQNVFTLVEYQLNGKIADNRKNGLHWRITFQHDAQKVRV